MNKNVYLFELDSVRKTKEEIERGQQCLYSEIVKNGNCVILSFNQVVDSIALLNIIKDDFAYKVIKTLFERGRIKISRFKNFRTASQYLVHAIDTNLNNEPNCFIFSAIPVKKEQKNLLEMMKNALINCDVSEFSDYISKQHRDDKLLLLFSSYNSDINKIVPPNFGPEHAINDLKYIKRVLEFILEM